MPTVLKHSSSITADNPTIWDDCLLAQPEIITPEDGLEISGYSGQQVTVGWDAVADADFYVIQLSLNSDFRGPSTQGWKITSTGSGGSGTYAYDYSKVFTVGTDLFTNTTHYFRVFAYKSTGCSSPASDTVSVVLRTRQGDISNDSSGGGGGGTGGGGDTGGVSDDPCDDVEITLKTSNDAVTITDPYDPSLAWTRITATVLSEGHSITGYRWSVSSGLTFLSQTTYGNPIFCIVEAKESAAGTTQTVTLEVKVKGDDGLTYRCTEDISVPVYQDDGITDPPTGYTPPDTGEWPPDPPNTGECDWVYADGCYDLAVITSEEDDCYYVEPLRVMFDNGRVMVDANGSNDCDGEGCRTG